LEIPHAPSSPLNIYCWESHGKNFLVQPLAPSSANIDFAPLGGTSCWRRETGMAGRSKEYADAKTLIIAKKRQMAAI
jgi:hypothetical protein